MSVVGRVDCDECNGTLDHSCSLDSSEDLIVTVELCRECIKDAKKEGREEGYAQGVADAREENA